MRLERIPNVTRETRHAFIDRNVKDEAEAIYTDKLKGYLGIEDEYTRHMAMNRSEEEWGVGGVHNTGIEGVWSLFKRSLVGDLHQISRKHLDRYIEEMEWRLNNRNNQHIFRDTVKRILTSDPLRYRNLVEGMAA